ncbi:MAG: histidine phosphatase family protein [Candidatus Nanoarchaeia archaeon]
MILYITRHGKTDNNREGYPFNGREDVPLNQEGRLQVYKLSRRLKDSHIDIIYTSPMKRTMETAKIINAFHKAKIKKDKRLKEVNFGIFDGKSLGYIKKNHYEIYKEREKDKFNYIIPEGESYRHAYQRAKEILGKIRNGDKGNIMVVTHGTLLKLLLMAIKVYPLEDIEKEYYKPTCLFAFYKDGKTIKWNSWVHL